MPESPVDHQRAGFALAMSQAAAMLGVALSVEEAYAASGQALVPCIDAARARRPLWAPEDRADGIHQVCARAGLEAREFGSPPAREASGDRNDIHHERIAVAKPFRLALETGGVVIGHNTWQGEDADASPQEAFGVVSDVTDLGDVHGCVVGDVEDMRIVRCGRNWVLHAGAPPATRRAQDAVARHALTAERIRATRAGDRLYGLAALDYWIDAYARALGRHSGTGRATQYACSVVDASRAAAQQLTREARGAASGAQHALTDASGRYARIAELLIPLASGCGDTGRPLLTEARDELARAADALESVAA